MIGRLVSFLVENLLYIVGSTLLVYFLQATGCISHIFNSTKESQSKDNKKNKSKNDKTSDEVWPTKDDEVPKGWYGMLNYYLFKCGKAILGNYIMSKG